MEIARILTPILFLVMFAGPVIIDIIEDKKED